MTEKRFGYRIKMARQMQWMSQQELADKIGKSKMAISKYERDLIAPSDDTLGDIARACHLRVEFFMRPEMPLMFELANWNIHRVGEG